MSEGIGKRFASRLVWVEQGFERRHTPSIAFHSPRKTQLYYHHPSGRCSCASVVGFQRAANENINFHSPIEVYNSLLLLSVWNQFGATKHRSISFLLCVFFFISANSISDETYCSNRCSPSALSLASVASVSVLWRLLKAHVTANTCLSPACWRDDGLRRVLIRRK